MSHLLKNLADICLKKDGWLISEDTTAITYKRIQWISPKTVTYKRNGLISLKEETE